MIRNTLSAVLIFWLVVCASGQGAKPAQGIDAGQAVRGPQVVETAARATLEKDAIRITLPLNETAVANVRVVTWLLSPRNVRTPETVAELKLSARMADMTLAWPKASPELGIADIGWYRIGYRVEIGGVESSHGILSVGAITANLIALRLAYPARIAQGQGVSARVMAMNPVTGKPLAGVQLKATLLDDDKDPKKVKRETHEAMTAHNGEALLSFAPIGEPGDDLDLTVTGTLSGSTGALAHDEVTAEIEVLDRTNVHVEMDKPLHKPGEMVHMRALAFWDSGRAAAGEPVTMTINDPDNKKLVEAKLKTNRFGIVQYDWKTSEQAAVGDYEVSFDLDNSTGNSSTGIQRVRIQRYDLPEFSVAATPDRAFYLDGQTPQVKIHAGYLFGKPVATGSVRVVRAESAVWNPKTGRYDEPAAVEATATLDANGEATLSLKAADEFEELKGSSWERFRDVKYRAMVTDATTGRTEPRNFAVRLTKEPVHIYLNAIGTSERDGEYMLSTAYADGTPTSCKVTLDWMDAQSHATRALAVTTNRYGLAKVKLHYPAAVAQGDDARKPQIRITARDKEGRISHFDDSLWTGGNGDIWISLDHALLGPRQAIEGTIHGKPGEEIDLDVLSESSVLEHWQMRMGGAEQAFSIPWRSALHGLITLRVYSMRVAMEESTWYMSNQGATRAVLYPDDHSLHANVKGLAATYAPGAPVSAQLDLRNAAGGSAAGVFGVSVFDTAVEQRAETEAEANDRWFGQGSWWLAGSSVGDVTLDSLNKTDASKPISSDLDLAAEAVLTDSGMAVLEITANDSSDARSEYEQQMQKEVKPLGDAILKANPENLPVTVEELKKFLPAAKLDEGILLDPWNTPYKAEFSEERNEDAITLTSAGPDKQFGTADDFAFLLVTRNVFAVPGERLNDLLSKAAISGQPLPATVDSLKKLVHDGGLNLDSAAQRTLQRNGKPYTYAIDLMRRFYFVTVKGDADDTVWRSDWIDYFGRTEERLSAALEKWAAAGNAFPEREADARRAFTAAGIDFDRLRDPLGRPFALQTKRDFSYARIDKVKAGNAVEGGTQKVTLTTEVIQIVRAGEDGAAQLEEVARFSHMVSQQSGSDVNPVVLDSGMFKGNTGAIGGTVTDPTGAVIAGATISVESESGDSVASATTKDDGTYVVPDLSPGFYKVRVEAKAFMSFFLTDVHVASSALTTVDVTLRVGTVLESVEVSAGVAAPMQTQLASMATMMPGHRKTSIVTSPDGSAVITEQTMTPRLRHVFEETAYWGPSLETNATGRAALKFTLPDSLTTWKLHAVGSTVDGRITAVDRTFKTFLPFFVDLDTPQTLTVGDAIWLPVNLRNYTTHVVSLPVTVKAADWFTLTTPATTHATVAPNAATPVIVDLRAASAADAGPLRITAANAHEGDAVEKTVKVHPDGEPKMITAQALLRGGAKNTVAIDLPADAISGSVHTELLLYPNLGANVYHAMKAVLERPYGCAEQTISAAYPSLLFLEMETAAKHDSPAKEQAQAYLQLGYDRLLGYFNTGGGLTYWGGNDTTADAALTAYGIEFLAEAKPYINVDDARIVSAMEWLLTQQDKDGAWKPRYGMYSARQTLYIAGALATVSRTMDLSLLRKGFGDRVKQAIARALEYASHSVLALHDPYANALRLNLAAESGDAAAVELLRKELIAAAQHGRDGAYWEFDGFSPFYGWGEGGRLETTAMALAAFNAAGNEADKKLEDDALLYLLRNRDGYGVWLSGQATVRVLKALLPLAVGQLQNPSPGDFKLTVNGKPLSAEQAAAVRFDNQLIDAPRIIDLTAMMHAGTNTLEFAGAGDAAFANAQLTAWFYVPWAQASVGKTRITVPGKDFGLDFGYECEAAAAKTGQPITCTVSARRFGSEGYGMMLAEVGLPPGADVDRASLGKLLDHWTIERYELQPDRIVFYLWSSAAEGEKFTFRFTPRYAIRAKAAPAKLSDYYNPDLNAVLAPQSFAVSAAAAP